MSEKRFKVCIDNYSVGLLDNSVKLIFIKFTNKEDAVSCKDSLKYQCNLMNELYEENEQLKKENEKLTKMLNANYKTNNELVQYIQMLESDNDE